MCKSCLSIISAGIIVSMPEALDSASVPVLGKMHLQVMNDACRSYAVATNLQPPKGFSLQNGTILPKLLRLTWVILQKQSCSLNRYLSCPSTFHLLGRKILQCKYLYITLLKLVPMQIPKNVSVL